MRDDIDVVLLSWRESRAMLERWAEAVRAMAGPDWQGTLIVFENGGTTAARDLDVPGGRLVLRAPGNLGFARAMDLALDASANRYVLLLNSDGRPEPGMADALAEAGAVWTAPAVHGPGEPNHPAAAPYEEDELPGMALLIDRERFLAHGGFDPLFFFYNEDFDASRRLRAAGERLVRVPAVRFHHGKGGRSRRGAFLRELHFARTDAALVWVHARTRREALRRLARGRARSLREHGLSAEGAAIALATLGAPAMLARAERRRRRPWNGAQLEAWLRVHRRSVDRVAAWAPAPSRTRSSSMAAS
jgi:GT2 family glycosyltransferase